MNQLLQYPFPNIPLEISAQDGSPLTNNKLSLVNHLIKGVNTDRKIDTDTSGIIVYAQYFIHSFAIEFASNDSPLKTSRDFGEYLFVQLLQLSKYPVVYFVTEMYRENLVKKFESHMWLEELVLACCVL